MNFNKLEDQVLAFCYDGSTSFKTLLNVTKMFFPKLSTDQINLKTESTVQELLNQGLISITKDANTSLANSEFQLTSEGEVITEELLIKNNLSDYLKY